MYAVLLTGDHATLARAELESLGPVEWLRPRIGLTQAPLEELRRLAFLREVIEHWGTFPDDGAGMEAAGEALTARADGQGSAAIATQRLDKSPNTRAIRPLLGGWLSEAGHTIDLDAPETTISAWFDGGIVLGKRVATAHKRFQDRGVERRAHFSPVSLHPRVASALVHLTGCRPGQVIYDPFCGTGGILLEAAIDGYHVVGSDLDPWMVQGTMTTLTDAGDEAFDGAVFIADVGDAPDLVEGVDAIVTDLPYGGASTTNQEAVASLYERAFAAFACILAPGQRAVIGHMDGDLLRPITDAGFEIEQVHEQFVHKSMTRRFAVVKRL